MPERGGSQRTSRALVAVPIAFMAAVVVIDVLAPPYIHLGPLLAVAPAITASFAGPWIAGLVAALAVAAQVIIAVLRDPDELISANHWAQITALILIGSSVVIFCVLRERRARELTQVRYVSEMAQRGVLRPLPKRLGPLRVSSVYLAAEAEAQIGGDVYAAARTTSSTRLILGDVRGKGMTSVSDGALLLGAFHAAAHRQAALDELVAFLDGSVCWNLAEPGETDEAGETFITAAILDIPDRDSAIDMIDCGHPPPVVVHDGNVTTIDSEQPAPPLGLGDLAHPRYHVEHFTFEPGDLLLLYTDGVIEARDSTGAFYPLTQRIEGWSSTGHPHTFLQRLQSDLLDHVGGRLDDDAAMIAVQRLPQA